jgi:hypothetical protein
VVVEADGVNATKDQIVADKLAKHGYRKGFFDGRNLWHVRLRPEVVKTSPKPYGYNSRCYYALVLNVTLKSWAVVGRCPVKVRGGPVEPATVVKVEAPPNGMVCGWACLGST